MAESKSTRCRRFSFVFFAVFALTSLSGPQSIKLSATGRFILPISLGKELLEQCSRPTPQGVAQFWQPSSQAIDELETALDKYLAQREKAGQRIPPKNVVYHRQYIGLVKQTGSKGEPIRLIYANFYPESVPSGPAFNESSRVMGVCDGGPVFWGIEYRVSTKTFENIAFNGLA